MTSQVQPVLPGSPPSGIKAMLLRDLGMAVVVSALAAVVIVLTVGRPETLHEQLVYSLCIGVPGYALVDLVRLRFWPELRGRPGPWLAMSGVMLATAPLAHWVGMHLGATVFGHRLPSLPDYPSQERISMILFTFIGFMLMTLMVEHRERLRRAERAHGEARLRAETIERQALQSQLQLLQAQIEPHMLFNTLANLQGLIALDPARANTMLDQLIQYLRATLGASRSASTTLEAEFAAMQAYLGLMGVRMGARLGYRLELPEDLRKLRVPPMLLQPLVENAIRHGLEPKIEGGEIRISAHAQGGMLELQVSDTGLGLARKPGSAGGGVGLATTRERLRVLYGGRASIELAPAQPHGALARLILPLETA